MSSIKKLASQTAVYGLSQIAGRFLNYLLVPLYTTVYNPAEYGVVTLMYSYVTFFNVMLTYGMETAFFRFASKHEQPQQAYTTALRSLLITSTTFVLLFSIFFKEVASLIRLPEHPEYVLWFVLIIAVDAVTSLPFALLRQQNRPIKFALIKNAGIASNILLNLYFLMLCPYAVNHWQLSLPFYQPEIGVGYVFISNLISSFLVVPFLYKEFLAMKLAPFSRTLLREMLIYALPLMIVGFAGMINETLDRNLITWLIPDVEAGRYMNGIYGANYKLSILMTLFIQAFRYAAEPFFFSHAKTSDKRTIYATVMDYFVMVCLFLFLLVTLYIDLFQHFIGPQFREGLKVVPILLLANMFLGVYYNLSVWYKLSDQTKKGAWISAIGAAITIILNVWWIPIYGYIGSAWATFLCYLSMMIICYIMGMKYYPIEYNVKKILGLILFALLLFFVSDYWINTFENLPKILANTALMIVFVGYLAFSEKNRILSIIHTPKNKS